MRDYINIYKVRARLLLMLATVLLAACSDDSDSVEEKKDMLQLVPYSQIMEDVTLSATRAVDYPTNYYSPYYGPNSIRVYTISKKEDNTWDVPAQDDIRSFTYKNGSWNSTVSVVNGKNYYLYGFMPVAFKTSSSEPETISSEPETITSEFETVTISCDVTSEDFSDGATLTFSNLPPVMAEDFSVVTGVLQVDKSNPAEATGTLKAGNFYYKGQATGSNFVCLMLDHLYSCVCFRFLVKDTYNELRTIKLKKVEMKSLQAISYPLTVTMKQTMNKDEAYSVSWGECTSYSSNKYVPLFISVNGEEPVLSDTEAQEVNGYFAPVVDEQDPSESVYNNLELRCTYDVYDKKGNLTRQNCEAVNRLPALTAGPNKRTVLTLTVNPTYLYVLSDPDLDNPTMVINVNDN